MTRGRPGRSAAFLARQVPRSSAYGYAQALEGTWDDYRKDTGRRGADRDDFADSSDFIGWYMHGAAGERAGDPRRL